jgi:hypothetical protein
MLKRIKSQEEIEGKRKKNQIWIGAILIGLMVLSTAGYAILNNESTSTKSKYNGYTFYYNNGYWVVQIQEKQYGFQYLPKDLENVSIAGNYNLQEFSGKVVYFIGTDPAISILLMDIPEIARYQEACLEGANCSNSELPIKNCENNLFIFNSLKNETRVYRINNCIYLEGEGEKAAERFLYKSLGVM